MEQKKNYNDFETQKAILLDYLQVMIAIQDWHGVSDVANDLRELEAKQDVNYRVASRADSVQDVFFIKGNEVMKQNMNGEYPWRKT